ncbi:MAG: S1C family serine protease [Chthoniobacterales bacterium]
MDGFRQIQITGSISHVSSGGPVLNEAGLVIGIVDSTDERGQNLNFAIPDSWIQWLLDKLPDMQKCRKALADPEPKMVPTSK